MTPLKATKLLSKNSLLFYHTVDYKVDFVYRTYLDEGMSMKRLVRMLHLRLLVESLCAYDAEHFIS